MKRKSNAICLLLMLVVTACAGRKEYNDGYIKYGPLEISQTDKEILLEKIRECDPKYDPEGCMLTQVLNGWNYHTDAQSGTYHDTRASLFYAVDLFDSQEPQYEQRAIDIVDKVISVQDTDPNSPSCGVWPYFEEEPLATKKTPIDYNWADFNAVCLLDIYMEHQDRLPAELQEKMKNALILAARSVQKRDCEPGYTNIAIMGTYVTYMVSHLFDLPEMKKYANERLYTFYQYTQEQKGFTEYNSPTYTIVALDELNRMQRHIVEPEAKRMIDELYEMGWEMIARHYHKPSGQWVGPNSRSYSTLTDASFYDILKKASDGKIDLGCGKPRADVKSTHHIPEHLLPYFLEPEYPRTEIDVFEYNEPQIKGYTYLTDEYVLSTASRSSMWNQRRPLTAYWGTVDWPHYLQVRFLHDFFDFSTVYMHTQQQQNKVVAVMDFGTDGGDKHITIGRIEEGKFKVSDLRLRFELGNCRETCIQLPSCDNDAFTLEVEGVQIAIQLLEARFGSWKGHWEQGKDEKNAWIDYVIYAGEEKDFDLTKIDQAVYALALSVGSKVDEVAIKDTKSILSEGMLQVSWGRLSVEVPVKPTEKPIKSVSQWFY